MGEWWKANTTRAQNVTQGLDALSQARSRKKNDAMNMLNTGLGFIKPELDANAQAKAQERLYGDQGVMRDFQMDTMAKENEYKQSNTRLESDLATAEEMETYFKTTGQKAVDANGRLTNDFLKWKHGYDFDLQRDKFNLERKDKVGSLQDWIYKTVNTYSSDWADLMIKDEAGNPIGYNPEKKDQLMTHLSDMIFRDKDALSQAGYKTVEEAKADLSRVIDTMDWAKAATGSISGKDATNSEWAGKTNSFNLTPQERGTTMGSTYSRPLEGASGLGGFRIDSQTKKKVNTLNELVKTASEPVYNPEGLKAIYDRAKRLESDLSGLWENKELTDAYLDGAIADIKILIDTYMSEGAKKLKEDSQLKKSSDLKKKIEDEAAALRERQEMLEAQKGLNLQIENGGLNFGNKKSVPKPGKGSLFIY